MIDKIYCQCKKQKAILEQIDRVEQPYRLILDKHYVQNKTLVQIACDMKYNYEYIKKANSIALIKFDELDKIFPKNY